ncbi:hypothetical protein E9993_06405 [Labilibacter sediminis]|nr:hypothetical protein E9993_06405 [Labilibacter sediminis]
MLLRKYITLFLLMLFSATIIAQETKKDVNKLTRKEVLEMKIEELSDYDLEEIMKLMDIVGASSIEELYELLLNKDVTSASKSEESVFDSPLSTTVLSHDQIISSGATSIEEALRLVPGVIVREKTNGNYDVHIRGNDNIPGKNMLLYSENANTLVMINGRQVFNYSHGGTLWESLPISFEDIDRIEVVRGPSSALYGANAVSGVINIITQTITNETPLVSGNFQGGSLSSYIGDIAFRKQLNDKLNVGITGNYEVRKRERDEIYIYNGVYDNGNPKYLLDGELIGNAHLTKEQIRKLSLADSETGEQMLNPRNKDENGDPKPYMIFPDAGYTPITIYGIDEIFTDPSQSKKRLGINGYIGYSPNETTNINISGGYQQSDALTSTMGDMPTPFAGKTSNTGYIDVRANIKDLSIQANYNGGTIDFMTGNEGFELDIKQINALAEYNIQLNKIDIRPGLNYQSVAYDDSPYITKKGRGYLNGEKTINILASSLRLDYKPTEKLRLIAALRAEKYNYPDDIYASWQLIGSYKINENNLLRVVYSRANQSSFLINAHSNYTWNLINRPYPRVMQFDGNKEHDLVTNDMIEIGYRLRPAKNILIDFEAFYNSTKNYGALMPTFTASRVYNPAEIIGDAADDGQLNSVIPLAVPDSVHMQFQSQGLKSKQLGASVNIDWVINEKLVANGHLTVQQTKLDNYIGFSRDETIEYQVGKSIENMIGAAIMTGTVPNPGSLISSDAIPTEFAQNDYKHKATPSYFGGFSLTYRPTKKFEIFPQAYFYGEQTFENQYDIVEIDSKFLLNAKVSYKTTDNLTFYVNGRNILNQKSAEFAFMDQTPTMILGGLHFKF